MAYSDEVMADSPALYLKLDEPSGLPQDSSGNGNHILTTSLGGSATYGQRGPIHEALAKSIRINAPYEFHATDDATLDIADVGTYEAWIRRGRANITEETIFAKVGGAYGLWLYDDDLMLAKSETAIIVRSTEKILDADSHHVVATKNGSTALLYIDGVDVTGTVSNQTLVDTAGDFIIGGESGLYTYDGWVAHIAVYPTVLSPARVLAHYEAGVTEGMLLRLYEGGGNVVNGGTLIAERFRPTTSSWVTHEEALTTIEASAITTYSDLYTEIEEV